MSTVLMIILTLLYPLAIWFGQGQLQPRFLAVLLLLLALTRLHVLKSNMAGYWLLGGVLALLTLAVWSNALLPLKLYPVLVNAAMLGAFGYSLIFPPSMAERFARLREPVLPAQSVGYMRRVTQVWCVFFVVNGAVALSTALWAPPAVWSLYNGVVAYLLMGLLFAGEYLVRCRFKRQFNA